MLHCFLGKVQFPCGTNYFIYFFLIVVQNILHKVSISFSFQFSCKCKQFGNLKISRRFTFFSLPESRFCCFRLLLPFYIVRLAFSVEQKQYKDQGGLNFQHRFGLALLHISKHCSNLSDFQKSLVLHQNHFSFSPSHQAISYSSPILPPAFPTSIVSFKTRNPIRYFGLDRFESIFYC